VHRGSVVGTYCKHDLPTTTCSTEQRYFTPDNRPFAFDVNGTRFRAQHLRRHVVPLCAECARAHGAQVLLVPNGSPFILARKTRASKSCARTSVRSGLAVVYANLSAARTSFVFDGGSFVLDGGGRLTQMSPQFCEHLMVTDFIAGEPQAGACADAGSTEHQVYQRWCWVRVTTWARNGFPGAVIGLSGGIDRR